MSSNENTMDKKAVNPFYADFKAALTQAALDAAKAVAAQRERVDTIRDNLNAERDNIPLLEDELEQASKEATQMKMTCVSDSLRASIQTAKDKIHRLKNDLDVARDMVLAMEKQLPLEQKEADRLAHGLQITMDGFVRTQTATADAKITPLILAALDERRKFEDAFRVIYAELGTVFQPVDLDLMPGILSQAQVRDIEARVKRRADAETLVRLQAASDAQAQAKEKQKESGGA